MGRRVKNRQMDRRDWLTRASEALAEAHAMPTGPARDEAVRKANELRLAGEMMGYLTATEMKSAN